MHAVRFQVVSIWQCKPSSVTVTLCNRCDIVTVRKRGCGKVMFYTCLPVILFTGGGLSASVHAGIHTSPGLTPPDRHPYRQTPPGQTPPCPVHAGIHIPCPVHSGIHPLPSACWDRHGYCCGQYASYWNAFLLFLTSR